MRKYVTEKVGILELFEIIFVIVALILGYYAFFLDVTWNQKVEEHGIGMCYEVNKKINAANPQILLDTECSEILNINSISECRQIINKEYLPNVASPDPFSVKDASGMRVDKRKFIWENLRRRQTSEISYITLNTLIAVMLVAHIVVASFFKSIEIRTKWNAVVQLAVLFSAGFGAMLLALSTSTIDNKYILLYKDIRACDLLRFCDRNMQNHPYISKDNEIAVNAVLDSIHACQNVKMKGMICVLLTIVMFISVAMILLAMDLVTTYEQESEEEQITKSEKDGDLEELLDEPQVEFEPAQDHEDVAAEHETPHRKTIHAHANVHTGHGMHGRSSEVILREYLHSHHDEQK